MATVPVVIGKLHDLLLRIAPVIEKFPRALRFSLADRLLGVLLDVLQLAIEARYTRDRRALLDRANLSLEFARHLVRLSRDLKALSMGQYEHAARLIEQQRGVSGRELTSSPARRPGSTDPGPAPGRDQAGLLCVLLKRRAPNTKQAPRAS